MAHEKEEEAEKIQYPPDKKSYIIVDEIVRGVSTATVYKALCVPMNSTVVAIKSINLDRPRIDLDSVLREAKAMTLLSHPNILKAHCSFTVDSRLWVVMPFMSAGSVQSIMSCNYPDGLQEPYIAIILKETLSAMCYLHDQGHLHRDIKAGNILIDSNGSVKLADFGVSTSIYEPNTGYGSDAAVGSASRRLTEVAGTPYWMAPEVIQSHIGYSFKADIWSFGIAALELAHGRPPPSHLPPSKSLLKKITKRFRFSDYEKTESSTNKKFSKSFKDMVGLCLDQDPSKRPTADKLLKHSFFKNCKGSEFLAKNVLQGLPSVEERFRKGKLSRLGSTSISTDDEGEDERLFSQFGEIVKHHRRRISGWNFNEDDCELAPVFGPKNEDDGIAIGDQGSAGGSKTMNLSSPGQGVGGTQMDDEHTIEGSDSNAGPNGGGDVAAEIGGGIGSLDRELMKLALLGPVEDETRVASDGGEGNFVRGGGEAEAGSGWGVSKTAMIGSLLFLQSSLEETEQKVKSIGMLNAEESGGELSTKELLLMQEIENLKTELEIEKKSKKEFLLMQEIENLKTELEIEKKSKKELLLTVLKNIN